MMIIKKKVADENKKGKRGWWEHKNGNCQNIIYLMMTVFCRIILCMYSGPPILQ